MIHETANMIIHPGNGSTMEAYPIPFRSDEPGWLRVTLRRQDAPADGEETPLHAGTGYTVEMADGKARLYTTEPVGADMRLRIRRRTPRTQRLNPLPGTPLAPEDVERALDRATMALQDKGGDGGLSVRTLAFPASEVMEGGGFTLLPHQGAAGVADRRGTVVTFFPEEYPEAPAPEDEPPGGLGYTPTDQLLEAIREEAEGKYMMDEWWQADYQIVHGVAWLEERVEAYRFAISNIIVNGREGTTFGYKGHNVFTAPASLTIQHGSVGAHETTEPPARSFRSTVIGHGAHAEEGTDEGLAGDALVIGTGCGALNASNLSLSLTAVGASALIYGYYNVSVGAGSATGVSLQEGEEYRYASDWTGHALSAVVGAGSFSHGAKNAGLGADTVVHGRTNCAFGHGAVANGHGTLAMGADATAQVPYDEHRPSMGDTPPDAAALAVGHGAEARSWETLAAGAAAQATAAPQTVAVGAGAVAAAEGCVAVGHGAAATAEWSTMFSNGVAEPGADAAGGFGYGSRLTLPGSVEMIARGQGDGTPPGQPVAPGARVFLHPHHGLSLSHAVTALPPAAPYGTERGKEPQDITAEHCGTLADGMLTFHCDGDTLRIHLRDGGVIRTASAVFPPVIP